MSARQPNYGSTEREYLLNNSVRLADHIENIGNETMNSLLRQGELLVETIENSASSSSAAVRASEEVVAARARDRKKRCDLLCVIILLLAIDVIVFFRLFTNHFSLF